MTFVYHPGKLGRKPRRSVGLTASFTAWKPGPWKFRKSFWGAWTLELPSSVVDVPGNSGHPEYKFVVDDEWVGARDDRLPRIGENFVVLHPGDDPAAVQEKHHRSQVLKTRPEDYDSPEQLANFREVAGTGLPPGRLYRSYHPFLPSRETPVEELRLQTSNRLWQSHGVRGIINLTDQASAVLLPGVPRAYAEMAAAGKVLFSETSYEHAYFDPTGPEFRATVSTIARFIAENRGPYLVHCRLGCDRTGVVTALLAGLAGLTWPELVTDYQKSNQLGIREYRDEALLAWSFASLAGADPRFQAPDGGWLAKQLQKFVLESGVESKVLREVLTNLRG